MKSSDYKAKLFELIIAGKGLQYVVDTCSELLGNPFVFANRSLQLVCKSSSCDKFAELFSWFDYGSSAGFRIAQEAEDVGYFQSIYTSDTPVPGKITGFSVNWLAARVRLKNEMLGNILTADCQMPFTEEYQELLPLVCQTIAFTLQQEGKTNYGTQNYAQLLVELLDGRSDEKLDDKAIRRYFELLGQKLPEKMRALVVRPFHSEHPQNPVLLDTQLRSQFPLSVGLIYKNDCVRILDAELSQDEIEERMKKYVQAKHNRCGISYIFDSAVSLHDAYVQADAAVRLSKTENSGIVHSFAEVSGSYLLEQVAEAGQISPEKMILPEISVLLKMEDSAQTEKIQDLAAYLSCGRSVTRAAELRGIHKNSMYYRLERIMKLTGLDLYDDETCIQLTLSLLLLGKLPFYKNDLCFSPKENARFLDI